MSTLDLFTPLVPPDRLHPIFKMILQDHFLPERTVLQDWACGFHDRDGKFVQEFQSTFESSFWELYLNACVREMGFEVDMSVASPDLVTTGSDPILIEATIAAPPAGGKPAFNYDASDIPNDFDRFNREAALRVCNSFDAKVKRYRNYYANLPHAMDKPYVIAIGVFDRPLAHMAASRPIIAALYGLYHDEEATIALGAENLISYNVSAVAKNERTDIPLGLFCSDEYAEVSAVIYSPVATWGKVRALAKNPSALTVYTTLHPNPHDLIPAMKRAAKVDYVEHLLDGLYILHNPFARRPIAQSVFSHPRLAQCRVSEDGELQFQAPDDFLLMRTLTSVRVAASNDKGT